MTNNAKNVDTLKVKQSDTAKTEILTQTIYKSGSISIDVKYDDFTFFVLKTKGNPNREFDLTMLKIPVKSPLELKWLNSEYACIVTWSSQAQSRLVFVPMKSRSGLVYLDKDIEETDSINNNIVYIDSLRNDIDKVVFKVENLLTRRSKVLELSMNKRNGIYPFYDKIILTKNNLIMTTATEKKSIVIKEINDGL